jgi:transposase InsO family protein
MAEDGVAVGPEVAAVVAAFVAGASMNVSQRCVELGLSRAAFYKYVARFRDRGVQGLFPDSRRPRRSPSRLPAAAEEALVRVRKEEFDAGWDYGAAAVLLRVSESPNRWPEGVPVPSPATVNRVFARRGLLTAHPGRRPRAATRRFARERVNELWQLDGFDTGLQDGTRVTILHLVDDCSRMDLALRAVTSENSADVWATFTDAVTRHGLPQAVLTDNGTAFSLRRRGSTAPFERQLDALGIRAITSRVGHPQTCGKVERAHQRVLKWLARRDQAATRAELQHLLDEYRHGYNTRKNTVLAGLTPTQRFDLGPFSGPDADLQALVQVSTHPVTSGKIGIGNAVVALGREHTGKTATVLRRGQRITVFIDDQLAADLVINPTRRYQPKQR